MDEALLKGKWEKLKSDANIWWEHNIGAVPCTPGAD